MPDLDAVTLNFSPASLQVLNFILGFLMFGVALDMKTEDFRQVLHFPKSALLGFFNQYLLFPAVTFGLIWVVKPPPGMALGMILVAACPGGNISNFLTHLSKGNTALSVCLTGTSTLGSLFMTPLLFSFWSAQYPPAANLLRTIRLDPVEMMVSIIILLGIPLTFGMVLAARFPDLVTRIRKPIRTASLIIFIGFVIAALGANWTHFMQLIGIIFGIIAVHNALALITGYGSAALFKLPEADRRAVAIEIAIHNTGLGLILIFAFFNGLGGMAIVAAWWGIWDLITGLGLAYWWQQRS